MLHRCFKFYTFITDVLERRSRTCVSFVIDLMPGQIIISYFANHRGAVKYIGSYPDLFSQVCTISEAQKQWTEDIDIAFFPRYLQCPLG